MVAASDLPETLPKACLCLVLTEDSNGRGLAQVVGVGRGVEMKIRPIGQRGASRVSS